MAPWRRMQSNGSDGGDDDSPATLNTETEGNHFLKLLFGLVVGTIAFGVGLVCITRVLFQISSQKNSYGAFVASSWPMSVRGPLGLFVLHCVIFPTVILVVSTIFGGVLMLSEDWKFYEGLAYVLENLLGLQDPLTNVSPEKTLIGRLVDVVMSVYAMLISTTILATSASLCLIKEIGRLVPSTPSAFLRCLCLYLPSALLLVSALLGSVMAAIEGWDFVDGFLFMAGAVAKLANPIVSQQPATADGALFESLCVCVALGVSGGVIGIVSTHREVRQFIRLLEGTTQQDQLRRSTLQEAANGEHAHEEHAHEEHADDQQAAELEQLREHVECLERRVDQWRRMREDRCIASNWNWTCRKMQEDASDPPIRDGALKTTRIDVDTLHDHLQSTLQSTAISDGTVRSMPISDDSQKSRNAASFFV